MTGLPRMMIRRLCPLFLTLVVTFLPVALLFGVSSRALAQDAYCPTRHVLVFPKGHGLPVAIFRRCKDLRRYQSYAA